jgi:hypothetical protein
MLDFADYPLVTSNILFIEFTGAGLHRFLFTSFPTIVIPGQTGA